MLRTGHSILLAKEGRWRSEGKIKTEMQKSEQQEKIVLCDFKFTEIMHCGIDPSVSREYHGYPGTI